MLKKMIRRVVNVFGIDLVRLKNDPKTTFLGLTALPIGLVLDIGANTGQFARTALQKFPRAQIHCFEPLAGPFAELDAWASTRRDRVIAHNVAVGDVAGKMEMMLHDNHTPSSSFLSTTQRNDELFPFTRAQRPETVEIRTLDDCVRDIRPLPEGDILIKMDVQGYEMHVIRGASATLRAARACVAEVSLDHLYVGQPTMQDIVLSMADAGLQYAGNLEQSRDATGHVVYIDAVFLRSVPPVGS